MIKGTAKRERRLRRLHHKRLWSKADKKKHGWVGQRHTKRSIKIKHKKKQEYESIKASLKSK